jgi:hypothetical protein
MVYSMTRDAAMDRDEALATLKDRLPAPTSGDEVWPYVEALAQALRADDDVTTDELAAALSLLPEYLGEIQRLFVEAARADADNERPRMTWYDVGIALGFPPKSAPQRATILARKLGVLPPSRSRDART